MKKVSRLAEIPLIVFTAHRDAREAAESGNATSYLEKPMRAEDLLAAIEAAMA